MKISHACLAIILLMLPSQSLGQSLGDRIPENHHAYLPVGEGPFPTLIAFPGCSGISTGDPAIEEGNPLLREDDHPFRRNYPRMAERLRDEGFAVLLIDLQKAEGLLTACGDQIGVERIAEYINESIAWARSLPDVDSNDIHLIGWSMGGEGIMKWLHGPRTEAVHVRSAIAVYTGCAEHETLTIPIPVLMLLGGNDDITPPSFCENLVSSVPIRELITLVIYPGARHGFDAVDAPAVMNIGNGMTIGYQREAAEASWVAILEFLEETR